MTRIGRAARESQQAEAILEPLEKGVEPQCRHTCRGQLQREWISVHRRQISATVEALWGDSSNRRSAAAARSANNSTAPKRTASAWTMPRSGTVTGTSDTRFTGTPRGIGWSPARALTACEIRARSTVRQASRQLFAPSSISSTGVRSSAGAVLRIRPADSGRERPARARSRRNVLRFIERLQGYPCHAVAGVSASCAQNLLGDARLPTPAIPTMVTRQAGRELLQFAQVAVTTDSDPRRFGMRSRAPTAAARAGAEPPW